MIGRVLTIGLGVGRGSVIGPGPFDGQPAMRRPPCTDSLDILPGSGWEAVGFVFGESRTQRPRGTLECSRVGCQRWEIPAAVRTAAFS